MKVASSAGWGQVSQQKLEITALKLTTVPKDQECTNTLKITKTIQIGELMLPQDVREVRESMLLILRSICFSA